MTDEKNAKIAAGMKGKKNALIHGHARRGEPITRTYQTWISMHRRCKYPAHDPKKIYLAKGIKVCPEWSKFAPFLADMGERPPGMTLDRIDSNGNYEPGNCRWATVREQARNTKRNKLTFETATQVAVLALRKTKYREIAAMFGISENMPCHILKGNCWPDALEAAQKIIEAEGGIQPKAEINIEAERVLFEKEITASGFASLERLPGGKYKSRTIEGYWKWWQAARRAVPAQPVAPAAVDGALCRTCGGSWVDPGGLPICRTCGHSHDQKPYAYEFGKSNGDGTYSVVIERGDMVKVGEAKYEYGPPKNAVTDRPVKRLYDRPAAQSPSQGEMVAGVAAASGEVAEWQTRYNHGGSIRPKWSRWENITKEQFDYCKRPGTTSHALCKEGDREVRVLFDHPAPSQPEASADKLAMTDEQIYQIWNSSGGSTVPFARAIIATLKGQQQ